MKINSPIGDALTVKSPKPLLSPEEEIKRQLERMLSSPDFRATPQQTAFFKFVVNQTLAGNAGQIKGYTVATEVFGRGPDFDQSIDPVVSIQAGRLRRAIERYYLTGGKNDPICIDIPKGTYVPVFEKWPHTQTSEASIDQEYPDIKVKRTWPSILIRPLSNLSDDPEFNFWGIGLATELADELNRYPDIRVLSLDSGNPNADIDQRVVSFVVDGSVRSDGTFIKMILNLTDTRTGQQIWSESSRSSIEAARLITFQEDLSRSIAVKIAGDRGLIMKTLDKESRRRPPQHSTVYEAVLRYFEYDVTFTPESFSRALAALEKAVIIEPEYGPVWSLLARLYTNIYVFEIPGFKRPLEKAFEFAKNGTRLSPENQRCSAILAYIHMFRNELTAGLAEAERALNLGPETLFMLDVIGCVMTLMGDFERGPALIKKTIQLNPFHGDYAHFVLWVNCLRQKDYEAAYHETLKLTSPALFLNHLARASSLGLLGNIEDGRKSAAELLKLKPDFSERGGILIRHYIKFEDIVERVIDGLNAVGIQVES
jgi:adenylate cyclase